MYGHYHRYLACAVTISKECPCLLLTPLPKLPPESCAPTLTRLHAFLDMSRYYRKPSPRHDIRSVAIGSDSG